MRELRSYAQIGDLLYKLPQVSDQISLALEMPDRHGTTLAQIEHPQLNHDCLSGYVLLE